MVLDHLNDLFEYRVEALAIRDDLDFDALVGTMPPSRSRPGRRDAALDGIVTSGPLGRGGGERAPL